MIVTAERIEMDESLLIELEPPRMESADAFLIAGLGERYTFETNQGIPELWQRFGPRIGDIPGQVGSVTYGVCCNGDDSGSFDYIAGVEVSGTDELPEDFSLVQVPAGRYLVFSHRDHISSIRNTVYTIWNRWLPESEYQSAVAPDFERYDDRFDPLTGTGVVEIWVPVTGA